MGVSMARGMGGGISRLIGWIAPSTVVLGTMALGETTTGSRTRVSDARETPSQTTAPPDAARHQDGEQPAARAVASVPAGAAPAAASTTAPVIQTAEEAAPSPLDAVQPEAIVGTNVPLREAAEHSLVPRWLAALRTQVFTGVAVIGLLAFSGLAALVTNGLTAGLDLATTQTIQGIGLPLFGPLMVGISSIGFAPQNGMIVVGIAALFWFSGYRTESGFAVAAAASVVLTETIKSIVARPRPGADLVNVLAGAGGHSFPSGHTLFYVTFFGFLGYLAYAQLKPGRVRTAILWLAGILILLIGPSRIWMGQHWVSDVLASYALGLAYLVFLVQLYSRRRLAKTARQAQTSTSVTVA